MFQDVTLPLWLLILIVGFAAVTFASHFLFPSVRWFFRARAERAMARINAGLATPADEARLAREGRWLDGAFYLGSKDLYRWLRELPPEQVRGIGMTRVSHINELYGGSEALEREQRRDARFFNTCMMMTALGAAVSDGLADGRVVSGVGGQYNFVAMAHALPEARRTRWSLDVDPMDLY